RCPTAEYADDVADYRAARRADNADVLRVGGKGALAFDGEQPLAGELFFQGLEGQAQGAVAGRLHGIDNQLIVAAPLEQRDLAAYLDRQSVAQGLAHACGVLPEQCTTHLSLAVLEGEIGVPG